MSVDSQRDRNVGIESGEQSVNSSSEVCCLRCKLDCQETLNSSFTKVIFTLLMSG